MVSVIMPCYNSANYIESSINSILNQTFSELELIVVDDCSIDDSYEKLKLLKEKDIRLKIFRLNNNSGAAVARNLGIKVAKGKYIAFCDSDDLWLPTKLEEQISFMKYNEATFSHSSYFLYNENGEFLNKRTTAEMVVDYKALIKYNWIGTSTVIFDCEKLGKFYMPNIRNRQDWALWLSIIKKAEYIFFLNKPLVNYVIRTNSISKKKIRLLRFHWIIYRKVESFSFLSAFYYLVINLSNHLKKNKIIDA